MNNARIKLSPAAISDFNLGWFEYLVNVQDGILNPGEKRIRDAVIALQEALAYQNHEMATERNNVRSMASFLKATKALAFSRATGSIGWLVKKNHIPYHAKVGDIITINYKNHGSATAIARIATEQVFPEGRGWILELLETNNSFGLSSVGWQYIAFWIPSYHTAGAGFSLLDEAH